MPERRRRRRRGYGDDPGTALAVRRPLRPNWTVVGGGVVIIGGGFALWQLTPVDNALKNPLRTYAVALGSRLGYSPDPSSRAAVYWQQIQQVSQETGVDASLIAAIGDRETLWGTSSSLSQYGPAGTGDGGHGHGLMQIDDRSHGAWLGSNDWTDPYTNISYAVGQILLPALNTFGDARTAADAYNAGVGGVQKAIASGNDPDSPTTDGNYGSDVMRRAAKFTAPS
jgi:soluble lytic murein transglycosylase-like protein